MNGSLFGLVAMLVFAAAACSTDPTITVGPGAKVSPSAASTSLPTPTPTPTPEPEAVTPAEFAGVDFRNFKYPFGWMKDGLYDYDEGRSHLGRATIEFEKVDYTDLTGDGAPEAIVSVFRLICGGSCDGGSTQYYFYAAHKKKPRLIGQILTGSTAYGCAVDSFKIENGMVYLEQFGQCLRKSDSPSNEDSITGKFVIADTTVSEYAVRNGKLKRVRGVIKPVSARNVINSKPETSIK